MVWGDFLCAQFVSSWFDVLWCLLLRFAACFGFVWGWYNITSAGFWFVFVVFGVGFWGAGFVVFCGVGVGCLL